jgi:hypothetical protein
LATRNVGGQKPVVRLLRYGRRSRSCRCDLQGLALDQALQILKPIAWREPLDSAQVSSAEEPACRHVGRRIIFASRYIGNNRYSRTALDTRWLRYCFSSRRLRNGSSASTRRGNPWRILQARCPARVDIFAALLAAINRCRAVALLQSTIRISHSKMFEPRFG